MFFGFFAPPATIGGRRKHEAVDYSILPFSFVKLKYMR